MLRNMELKRLFRFFRFRRKISRGGLNRGFKERKEQEGRFRIKTWRRSSWIG